MLNYSEFYLPDSPTMNEQRASRKSFFFQVESAWLIDPHRFLSSLHLFSYTILFSNQPKTRKQLPGWTRVLRGEGRRRPAEADRGARGQRHPPQGGGPGFRQGGRRKPTPGSVGRGYCTKNKKSGHTSLIAAFMTRKKSRRCFFFL